MARPKKAEDAAVQANAPVENTGAKPTHVVAKKFSDNPAIQPDRSMAKRYEVGEDVSHLDAKRLEYLESRGYVKKTGKGIPPESATDVESSENEA